MGSNEPTVDFYGCPEYFVTKSWSEPIGNGCVRFFAACERNGQMVPLYTSVMEAPDMLDAGRHSTAVAQEVSGLTVMMRTKFAS